MKIKNIQIFFFGSIKKLKATSYQQNVTSLKVWYVAIFVCMSTEAVHLELVSDLTTEAFIASLKRLFSRRGISRAIHFDNAKNFVGAS